jgi:hypothetical protein
MEVMWSVVCITSYTVGLSLNLIWELFTNSCWALPLLAILIHNSYKVTNGLFHVSHKFLYLQLTAH